MPSVWNTRFGAGKPIGVGKSLLEKGEAGLTMERGNIQQDWNLRLPGWRARARWPGWEPFFNWSRAFRYGSVPALDMYETDRDLVVEAEVPGYSPQDIQVQVSPDVLVLRGKVSSSREERGEGYYVKEREAGTFTRTVRLPAEVVPDGASARYKNGVLTITIPKKDPESRRVHNVPVESES